MFDRNIQFVVAFYGLMVFWMNYTAGIIQKTAEILSQADAIVAPTLVGAGVGVSALSLMNYVLPLDAGITLFEAWMGFYLICNAFRMVKAWIPTLT